MAILVASWELAKSIGPRVEIDARTVGELIDVGIERYGDEFRQATKSCLIVVNGRGVSYLKGKRTKLGPTDEVCFVKAAAGG